MGSSFNLAASPSLYLYYDFDVEAFTLEGGVSHLVELNEKSGIELGLTAGYVQFDSNAGGSPDYAYAAATADYVYSLSESTDLTAGLRVSKNNKDLGASPDGNAWGGLSLTTRF